MNHSLITSSRTKLWKFKAQIYLQRRRFSYLPAKAISSSHDILSEMGIDSVAYSTLDIYTTSKACWDMLILHKGPHESILPTFNDLQFLPKALSCLSTHAVQITTNLFRPCLNLETGQSNLALESAILART